MILIEGLFFIRILIFVELVFVTLTILLIILLVRILLVKIFLMRIHMRSPHIMTIFIVAILFEHTLTSIEGTTASSFHIVHFLIEVILHLLYLSKMLFLFLFKLLFKLLNSLLHKLLRIIMNLLPNILWKPSKLSQPLRNCSLRLITGQIWISTMISHSPK